MNGTKKPNRNRPTVCITLDADVVQFLRHRAEEKRSGGVSGVITDAILSYPPFIEYCRGCGKPMPMVAEQSPAAYKARRKK